MLPPVPLRLAVRSSARTCSPRSSTERSRFMLTLIPFVMIRARHCPTLVAGLAFIPLQVLITVVSAARRHALPPVGGACHVRRRRRRRLGYAMTLPCRFERDLLGGYLSPHPVAVAGHGWRSRR